VKGAGIPVPDPDVARQREVVDAFFLAARGGDFDALVAVLDPDVLLRIDAGASHPAASMVVHGAAAVARQAHIGLRPIFAQPVVHVRPALVNGAARRDRHRGWTAHDRDGLHRRGGQDRRD
jgi:ketosteroid isomerase-like protein